ncbi:hypothetical protein JW868_03240 [Candidatus Woesearchaeota archaeon]|nr:hypothetical protein [Candidatus Woesearchaeota archaeon]
MKVFTRLSGLILAGLMTTTAVISEATQSIANSQQNATEQKQELASKKGAEEYFPLRMRLVDFPNYIIRTTRLPPSIEQQNLISGIKEKIIELEGQEQGRYFFGYDFVFVSEQTIAKSPGIDFFCCDVQEEWNFQEDLWQEWESQYYSHWISQTRPEPLLIEYNNLTDRSYLRIYTGSLEACDNDCNGLDSNDYLGPRRTVLSPTTRGRTNNTGNYEDLETLIEKNQQYTTMLNYADSLLCEFQIEETDIEINTIWTNVKVFY